MKHAKTRWLLVGALCLALWPTVSAQETRWEALTAEAIRAFQQDDYAEAEKLLLAALKEAEKFGEQDRRFDASFNNLAVLYQAQRKYADAEQLYQRALAIRQEILGPEHPDVAQSLDVLAELYFARRKYAEAEPLLKRALAIMEKALGPEHPDTATALSNLAQLYEARRKYSEAEPLYQRALAGNIETVAFCDLVRDFERYDKHVVRVRAIYMSRFEVSQLYDPACDGGPDLMWVNFTSSVKSSTRARLREVARREALVVFVGRFDGPREPPTFDTPNDMYKQPRVAEEFRVIPPHYGHLNAYRFQLVVMSIEEVGHVHSERTDSFPEE